MSFTHPWLLVLLLLPFALAAWELARGGGGHRMPLPFDHAQHAPRWHTRWLARLLTVAGLLPAILLAAALILLAGPRRLGPPTEERVLTNIEILLDVSGSMSSPISYSHAGATRSTAAIEAIQQFTARRKGDAFGLTIFGSDVVRWVPLTRDLSAIQNATPFLDPTTMPPSMGGTLIGKALEFSRSTLARQPRQEEAESLGGGGDRLIILVTDGESFDLSGGRATTIGNELREDGIVVHAINVGDGAAPAQLSEVVAPTGGRVYSAHDPAGLAQIFAHIDSMHPVRVRPTQPEPVDNFTPFALAGLILLALHQLCLLGLRYTPW